MDGLTALDERIFLAVNGWSSPAWDAVFGLTTWLGHGVVLGVLVLGGMALFDRARLRAHAIAMVASVAVGALAVEALKSAVDRDRPAVHFAASAAPAGTERVPGAVVRMPGEWLFDRSFPSGHTQAAFGAATYLSLLYPPLAPIFLVVAGAVGLSRIYLGVHFPLDVLCGAAVGAAFSVAGFFARRRIRGRSPQGPGEAAGTRQ